MEPVESPRAATRTPPFGFRYCPELITPDEEHELVCQLAALAFAEFEFHGYVARRRVLSFGWDYEFAVEDLRPAAPLPALLVSLRERAAAFAELRPGDLPHALVTEYAPGAAIGWHRDKTVFSDVVGVSLVSPCVFRLRRKWGTGWERHSMELPPRSAYLLRGPVRSEWEHSIPAVPALRYSVTFRSLRPA